MTELYLDLGGSVRASRKAVGKTLEVIAKKTGMSVRRLEEIENGVPNEALADLLEEFVLLCNALSISLEELFDVF